MRSSQTERAICMALGLWVTDIAFILNFSLPKILFAWATASLNTCSNLFWLRTAPILTIFGSQPPRAQEQEMKKAKRNSRIFMVYGKTKPRLLNVSRCPSDWWPGKLIPVDQVPTTPGWKQHRWKLITLKCLVEQCSCWILTALNAFRCQLKMLIECSIPENRLLSPVDIPHTVFVLSWIVCDAAGCLNGDQVWPVPTKSAGSPVRPWFPSGSPFRWPDACRCSVQSLCPWCWSLVPAQQCALPPLITLDIAYVSRSNGHVNACTNAIGMSILKHN